MKKLLILILFLINLVTIPAFSTESGIEYIHNEPNIYVFKFDTKRIGHKIKPYIAPELDTVKNVYKTNDFIFVVNGGFFDPQTAAPASYVTIDCETVENPYDNASLLNSFTDEEMEMIASRAELRIYVNKYNKLRFDIAFHKDGVPDGWKIKHALQAGPMVYPKMDLEKEYFVKYGEDGKVVRDSIEALKRRARAAVALKGNDLYVIIFTKQGTVTMQDVYQYCAKMKFDKAMALDGGGSVGVNYCDDIEIISEDKDKTKNGRKVKSFLVVEN